MISSISPTPPTNPNSPEKKQLTNDPIVQIFVKEHFLKPQLMDGGPILGKFLMDKRTYTIKTRLSITWGELRKIVSEQSGHPLEGFGLMFAGKCFSNYQDDDLLDERIQKEATLHIKYHSRYGHALLKYLNEKEQQCTPATPTEPITDTSKPTTE